MADRLSRTLLALVVLALPLAARAQLADPTRPPADILEAASESGVAAGPVLQSVLIPENGRPLAVIDGLLVRLGERYRESRLIKLTEREAVLDGPAGIDRLRLTPDVEKINLAAKNTTKTLAPKRAQGEGRQ